MSLIKTPFSDAIESTPLPKRGTKGGKYDNNGDIPGVPGRDSSPDALPELYRDTAASSSSPSNNGTVKTPYTDEVCG